jgi:hypothetical protein
VIFYFWKPRDCAEAIAGGQFPSIIPEKLLRFERNNTHYFVIGHPASGYGDAYFQRLGRCFHEYYPEVFAPVARATPGDPASPAKA